MREVRTSSSQSKGRNLNKGDKITQEMDATDMHHYNASLLSRNVSLYCNSREVSSVTDAARISMHMSSTVHPLNIRAIQIMKLQSKAPFLCSFLSLSRDLLISHLKATGYYCRMPFSFC